MRRSIVVFALVVALAGCGGNKAQDGARSTPERADSPTTTAVDSPSSIALAVADLPATGLAMDDSDADSSTVVLLNLHGVELLRLRGWHMDNAGAGPVWLTRDERTWYRLDPTKRALVREPRPTETPISEIPPPDASGGHWVTVTPSPDGSRALAQWNGECEVPTAYLVANNHIIKALGGDTIALGWLDNETAVISTLEPGCGDGDEPGTYKVVVDRPTERSRITRYTYGVMWSAT